MYNILYVSHEASLTGAPISLFSLIKKIDRKKFTPFFLCPKEGPLLKKVKEINVLVKILKRPYIFHLLQFIKNKDINLIYVNTVVPIYAAFVGRVMHLPVIWHIREDLSKGWWNKVLVKIIKMFAHKIVVNSHYTGSVFKRCSKVITIYNGVDLNEFHPGFDRKKIKGEFNINLDSPVVGTIGNFTPVKGCQYFFAAIKEVISRFSETKFLVVGHPHPLYKSYYEKMRKLVKELGIEKNLIFIGETDNIPEVIASFDLFVLSSLKETMGRVIIEAMAMGKPVIATSVGGIPEVVEDGITGYLVPSCHPQVLAKTIIKLLQDKKRAKKMGMAGRKRVEAFFNLEKNVARIMQVQEKLLCPNF